MAQQPDMAGLVESWTKTQQKLWNDWMEALQKSTGGGAAQGGWQQGLEHWQQAVDATLDAQSQAMARWTEQVAAMQQASPEAKQWAEEGAKMMQQWTEAQRALWQQWFGAMNQAASGADNQPGAEQLKQFMAGWEQVNQQMQQLQREWMANFGGGPRKP